MAEIVHVNFCNEARTVDFNFRCPNNSNFIAQLSVRGSAADAKCCFSLSIWMCLRISYSEVFVTLQHPPCWWCCSAVAQLAKSK